MTHHFTTLYTDTLKVPRLDAAIETVCWIDFDSGQVRYEVNGARVTGVFLVSPFFGWDMVDPDTRRVEITFGDRLPDTSAARLLGWKATYRRPKRPVVNGTVTLVGSAIINLDKIDENPTPYKMGVTVHRQVGDSEDAARAPSRTSERITAIMCVLAQHWAALPGNAEIRLAAARQAVRTGDQPQRKRERIERLRAEIAERRAELDRHEADQEAMRRLIDLPAEPGRVTVLAN